MKKVLKVIICFLCLFIIVGCSKEKTEKNIQVICTFVNDVRQKS